MTGDMNDLLDGARATTVGATAFDRLGACGVVLDAEGVIVDTNRAWRLFAHLNDGSPATSGVGTNYLDVCDRGAAEGVAGCANVAAGLREILRGERHQMDSEYPCPSPTEDRWFMLQASAVPVDNGSGAVVLHVDVTARKQLTDQVGILAEQDSLTGLPNRRAASRYLDEALAVARTAKSSIWVLFVESDDGRSVNDRFGGHVRDELMVKVGLRARRALRPEDLLCRFGENQFVVSCSGMSRDEAHGLADRLRTVMSAPFQVGELEVAAGVSVGVAESDATSTVESMFRAADADLHVDTTRVRTPLGANQTLQTEDWRALGAASTSRPQGLVNASAGRHRSRRRNRFGVRTRLIGAIVAPLLVVGVGAGQFVEGHRTDVRHIENVLEQLDRLTSLSRVRSSLLSEWLVAEILVPDRRPGLDVLTSSTFGALLVNEPEQIEAWTDDALASLDPSDRPFLQSELDQARSDRALWSTTIDGISGRLRPFYERTLLKINELATTVRVGIVEVGNNDLVESGTILQRSIALPGAAAAVLRSVTDLFLSEPDRRTSLQSDTAAAAAIFAELADSFTRSLVDTDSATAGIWLSSPQPPVDLRQAVTDANTGKLTTPDRAPLHPASLGLTLIAGIDWLVSINGLPSTAAAATLEVARDVLDQERAAQRTSTLLAVGVIAASVLIVVALARSIITPIRRLTDQARQLGAGDLHLNPLPLRGPPDVVVASDAMNDVVDNLVLIERKAAALADGLLEEPSLQQSLPGALGTEIGRSVDRLTTTVNQWNEFRSQLVYDATHDSLTGVANRSALAAALASATDHDNHRSSAVVFVDLNNFKRINDLHGHAVGDELLRVVAERLVGCTPDSGLVCRWGGDEFVTVLPDVTGPAALAIAFAMVESIATAATIDGSTLRITASAGVAATGETTTTDTAWSGDLLRQADYAAYHAKSVGPGAVTLFDDELRRRIEQEAQVAAALATALEPSAQQLRLLFQPIMNAVTGELRGMEALLRWDRPGVGLMQADDFIPIAERSDLIVELDQWVLRAALRQLQTWTRRGMFTGAVMSVNVSARSLRDGRVVDRVMRALTDSSIAPQRLMLEITETALITDIAHASGQLRELRSLGVAIAIDDFGTGFTSVSQLRDMPIDELKIDKNFVHELGARGNLVLVQMMNDLAHHLNIPTIAEGIETPEQRDIVKQIGCDALQGFLFAQPLHPAEFARQAAAGTWTDTVADSREPALL